MKEPYLTELPGFIDLDYMKGIIEQTEADKEKDAKENEGKKVTKRRPKYLDEKIKKEEEAKRASKG